ncbi:hypothetical protein A2673_02400 [Candidatus Kaiserbacteria bacterium RIFCSPHIGHO2_01_FULL_50_13]|uniref:Uncharacterized protein n=1 Tax=Candidatus Kaiserbacteria bacterium RIFCSPLOWO2_01_FULL_50_24 TaxID=1798507 RepID=A0A1F6EQX4_9BACT|nr:MAG: hypothetical protein A2673_02400 [Candidatus Kaiserbacteria bacterium RIFCSPHIGHO2_01_FULL_50_13]OGG76023.1 MAG: hypothetical protein A3A34_00015 [Candidatus Kaiserbacteria bacterium RIFCSPLOWO2_01_FULL_50_24]OGG82030.1 MAG: hypothetical protein A3H74_03435 [Candidatus Kaiserbacteria bacterium RIFCSPLOWO2_02_FULL_51_13]
MGGDITFGEAFASVFEGLGDLLFRFIPAAITTIAKDYSAVVERPALIEPVPAPEFIEIVERGSAPEIYDTLFSFWVVFVPVSVFVSLLFLTLIIYCVIRIQHIRHFERVALYSKAKPVASLHVSRSHLRWRRIQEHVSSDNEHSWRLAILEADIMLNELLDVLGYRGETMADKMKQVVRGDFNTIDLAWEAHKVRNRVAHEGAEHLLSGREARRVISLYEQVFREFKFIE